MKKYIVVPEDALNYLTDKHELDGEAFDAAKSRASYSNMKFFVVQVIAVAEKEPDPVILRRLT